MLKNYTTHENKILALLCISHKSHELGLVKQCIQKSIIRAFKPKLLIVLLIEDLLQVLLFGAHTIYIFIFIKFTTGMQKTKNNLQQTVDEYNTICYLSFGLKEHIFTTQLKYNRVKI